jgi:hypothetical protein
MSEIESDKWYSAGFRYIGEQPLRLTVLLADGLYEKVGDGPLVKISESVQFDAPPPTE